MYFHAPDKLIIWLKQPLTIRALSNDGLLSKLMNYTASVTDYLILLAKQQMYISTCLGLNDFFSLLLKGPIKFKPRMIHPFMLQLKTTRKTRTMC